MSMQTHELVVGIDPGAATGMVALAVPYFPRLDKAQVLAHKVVRASSRQELTHAERDISHYNRIADFIVDAITDSPHPIGLVHVVLEEPTDASTKFRGSHGAGHGEGVERGTHMRLGVAYGLAVAGVEAARLAISGSGVWSVTSYPATTVRKRSHKVAPRIGWMDNGGRIPARELTLRVLRGMCRGFVNGATLSDASDDEIMALGVLRYHLEQGLAR